MPKPLNYKASRILLVANWDWVIYNFRLPLAAALVKAGYEVIVICPLGIYTEQIRALGYQVELWPLSRRSTNPIHEAVAIRKLHALYARLRPGIVHHFTIKPNFYGSVAALTMLSRKPRVINTFTGLGFFFSKHKRAQALRGALLPVLRASLLHQTNWTVFQNPADLELFLGHGLGSPERARLIPGSGVDTTRFQPVHFNQDAQNRSSEAAHGDGFPIPLAPPLRTPCAAIHPRTPIVLTGARLLWDKGISDIVKAAQLLRHRSIAVEFQIAGGPDPGNLAAIPTRVLKGWEEQGLVRFLGHRDDVRELLMAADLALLPSYHEGLPRFLLEAAASGLPLIGTDIPGCRMIIRSGINGVLVPPKSPEAIADTIVNLLSRPDVMANYGHASRRIAETEYSEQKIVSQYLSLYLDVAAFDIPGSA
jgi:glycosyltransferase involved in cell wall biosynthesis